MEAPNETLFSRMLEEICNTNAQYVPIYGICSDVREIEPKTSPVHYLVTVTCNGETVISKDVTTYEEFSEALTKGIGIGLGVTGEDDGH